MSGSRTKALRRQWHQTGVSRLGITFRAFKRQWVADRSRSATPPIFRPNRRQRAADSEG